MNADIFSTGSSSPSTSTGFGGFFGDLLNVTQGSLKTYMDYDLQRDMLKLQRVQAAAGYNSGYGTPTSYDYTQFADDGGLMGGVAGLRGAQIFLLGIAAIAAYALVNKS